MEELEQMERRLKVVQEKCMSQEERAVQEENKFHNKRKNVINTLKIIKKDIFNTSKKR